jgi:hypothetical protein
VSYPTDLRNPNFRTPMFNHQKKSMAVIPHLIQWSARFSRIRSSRLSIPKSLVDANPEFPNPDANFGYSTFVSLRVAMSCNSAPRSPKSQLSISRNPEMLTLDMIPGAGPTTRLSTFSRLHTSRVLMQRFWDINPRNPEMEILGQIQWPLLA